MRVDKKYKNGLIVPKTKGKYDDCSALPALGIPSLSARELGSSRKVAGAPTAGRDVCDG